VPAEFFNRTFYRLMFTVDQSLVDAKGGYLNPRVTNLQREQDTLEMRQEINRLKAVVEILADAVQALTATQSKSTLLSRRSNAA